MGMRNDDLDRARDYNRAVVRWVQIVEQKGPNLFAGCDVIKNGTVPDIAPQVFLFGAFEVASERCSELEQLHRSLKYELPACATQNERHALIDEKLAAARSRSSELLRILLPGAAPDKSFLRTIHDRFDPPASIEAEQELVQIVFAAQMLMHALYDLLRSLPDSPLAA